MKIFPLSLSLPLFSTFSLGYTAKHTRILYTSRGGSLPEATAGLFPLALRAPEVALLHAVHLAALAALPVPLASPRGGLRRGAHADLPASGALRRTNADFSHLLRMIVRISTSFYLDKTAESLDT